MKKLYKIILLVFTQISFAQEYSIINTKTSSGINFPKEYFYGKSEIKNFTVTENEIKMLEDLLHEKHIENKTVKDCIDSYLPYFMCKNLNDFKRQYFGFYLGDQKMIYVKFIPSKDISTSADVKSGNRNFGNQKIVLL